jgi:hypothetical protein
MSSDRTPLTRDEVRQIAANIARKDRAMSRWRELVHNLLTDLETEATAGDGVRVSVDHKLWEAEQKASKTVPTTLDEAPVRRIHGFQCELIETLSKRLKNDPANKIWLEARSLLENQWLRVPEHQRPDLK